MTAQAVPTGFTQPHLAVFSFTLPHIHHWTQLQLSPFPSACVIQALLGRAPSIPSFVFGNVRIFLTVKYHCTGKILPVLHCPCLWVLGRHKHPTAPTTGIWEHSQGVKEVGDKHCWPCQTSFFQLPTLMLEESGCSGAGGQPSGTASSQVCLWKR